MRDTPLQKNNVVIVLSVSALAAAGIAAYGNALDAPFFMDDVKGIVANRDIRSFSDPLKFFDTPTPISGGRPVAAFTFALNYAIHALHVRGYRVFNLGVHILAAVVLFGLVRRTLLGLPQCTRLPTAPIALVCAMAWMLHPLQTECINYVAQRTESVMGLLYFLTLYCAARGLRSLRRRWWHVACAVACALGMATKQVMVTAPVAVVLYDLTFAGLTFREALRRRSGLYATLAATWFVLAGLMFGYPDAAVGGDSDVTSFAYAVEQCIMIVKYIGRVFWPASLIADYGHPEAPPLLEAAPYVVVLMLLLVGAALLFVRRPQFGFGAVWFFITLAPTSSFIPITTEVGAERRLYVPLAGLVAMVIIGGYHVLGRVWKRRTESVARGEEGKRGWRWRWPLRGIVFILLGALALRTVWRNSDYSSTVRIWQTVVDAVPTNYRAHNNIGTALVEVGRIDEAVEHYRRAIELRPRYADAHNHLGAALRRLGGFEEAVSEFRWALELDPSLAEAHYNLGNAVGASGELGEAVRHYRQAIRLKGDYADALYNLGNTLVQLREFGEAAAMFQNVVDLEPADASAQFNLGVSLVNLGRSEEAVSVLKRAIELQPGHAKARVLLGDQYGARGELNAAIEEYRRAVEFDAQFALAHYRLGRALRWAGHYDEALPRLAEAARLGPNWPDPLVEIAWVLSTQPDDGQCRPVEAVDAAERAAALVERPTARMLDALAASYAVAGDFAKAVEFAEKAVQRAESEGDDATTEAIRQRISLYKQGRRYVDRGAGG